MEGGELMTIKSTGEVVPGIMLGKTG